MRDDNDCKNSSQDQGQLTIPSHEKQQYAERELDFKDAKSNGCVREIKFKDVHIMRISLQIHQTTSIPFMTKSPKVILFFSMQGDSLLNTDYISNLSLKASSHNIIYTEPSLGNIQCTPGKYEVFYISMSLEMFKSYFPRDEDVFEKFKRQMEQSDFSLLRNEHGVLNHKIIKVIEDICHPDSLQSIKPIYIIAKVIELLSIQLNELCTICQPLPLVRPEDVEKMYEVKNFILKHLNENHSLSELAQIVGTNDYTLKKEFKQLFGTTVFGFWSDAKMDNAQKLLAETTTDIKEISEIIGYKNPQHFSTAFKRKFGLTPSQFRKNRE
ncbi:MAG: AraC family transcriptional regulator [Weeksellaceae bacterium]|nr:AraC family transcriptional regulator [Weeksellaceae bacterium]